MSSSGNNSCNIVLVAKEFFEEHSHYAEMLDPNDVDKQSRRCYEFVSFKYNNNNILVPLRSNIPNMSKLGKIGYKLPSTTRPNAGLDYRKILIVNDSKHIIKPTSVNIPNSQTSVIVKDKNKIEKEVQSYIKGYIRAVEKGRATKDSKYKYSTLCNFHKELGIESDVAEAAITKAFNAEEDAAIDCDNNEK